MSAPRWILLGALLLASPAVASEDAGTRSIFAEGAGIRALALGGAYSALAADASATLWNPAGLALVSRREVQISHTEYDLGFAEEYAAFVLPGWRWGAASVAYRRFGTGAVERVDDRNVSLGESGSSSESEITFGYGRSMGALWSLGAAVKMQQQSLAGFQGSGYGADLGIAGQPFLALFPRSGWADRLSAGLMVRNAIQPSIRLDQESVRDPSVLRLGLAYRSRTLIGSVDLERSPGMSPRLHGGFEYSPHPVLALRGGLRDGAGTAGAGIHWQGWALDYAFESEPLASIHRVGLSYSFGRSIAEQRAASLRADEERIQARLADAFQRIQDDHVNRLLTRAGELRAQGRYAGALEILATVATLEPGEPRALELELVCLREHALHLESDGDLTGAALEYGRVLERVPADSSATAGRARCRAESDKRATRTELQRKVFAAGMDAFGSDDLAVAREAFTSILAGNPGDQEAGAMLRRVRSAITKRTDQLLSRARRDLDAGRLKEASAAIEQAKALDRNADGLLSAELALIQARKLAEAVPAPVAPPVAGPNEDKVESAPRPVKRPPLSAQQRKELDDLYRRGLAALEQKRPNDAVRYWELVWSADPKYQRVAEYLKREYLMRGMDSFANGRLDDAIGWWERAADVDPNDERTKGYLARARKQLARTREILGDNR